MIAIVFDLVITILLVVTIGFCVLLCTRLKRLKADEQMMRSVVADIVQSTGKAEYAIRTLKATADECDHTLGVQLRDAEGAVDDIKIAVSEAENTGRRLAELVVIAKSAGLMASKEKAPDAKPEPVAATAPAAPPQPAPVAMRMADIVPAAQSEAPPTPTPIPTPAPAPAPAATPVSALEALRARAA